MYLLAESFGSMNFGKPSNGFETERYSVGLCKRSVLPFVPKVRNASGHPQCLRNMLPLFFRLLKKPEPDEQQKTTIVD
jgi:hypothetical protein